MPKMYYCYINNVHYLYSTSSTATWASVNNSSGMELYFNVEIDTESVKYKKNKYNPTDNDIYMMDHIYYIMEIE